MDDFSISIDTRDLEAKLSALPEKVQKKALQKALQAAGDVMLAAVVIHTPERTDEPTPDSTSLPPGILKADMHTQVTVNQTSGAVVKVGPTSIGGHVGRWQNNGWDLTVGGRKGKGGKVIRQIPGKLFMEAAFDESSPTALSTFYESLGSAINGDTTGED